LLGKLTRQCPWYAESILKMRQQRRIGLLSILIYQF
jgi:hypothetical protein